MMTTRVSRAAGVLGLCAAIWMPVAPALAGSHSAQSAAVTVDTRDDSFRITDVSSRYCAGAYGEGGRHVHFLAGVSLDVAFTANVEWGTNTPSRLEFNGVSQNWPNATKSLNVGSLGAGGKLDVVAVAADGARSTPFRANFDVVPLPPFANMLFYPQAMSQNNDLRYTTPEFEMDVFKGQSGVIQGVPIPGETMEIQPRLKAEAEFGGDGTLTIKAAVGQNRGIKLNGTGNRRPDGKFGKAAGVDFGFDVEGDVVAAWSRSLNAWVVNSGYLGLNFYGKYSSPPFYLYAPPPIYARFEIGADGQIGLRITDLGSGHGWTPQINAGGTLPDIKGIIGCGASGVLALEGYIGVAGKFAFQGPPVICTKLGVEGKIGAQVVLLMFTLPLDIWSGAYWIVGGDGPQGASALLRVLSDGVIPINLASLDTRQFHLLERDYLNRVGLQALAMARMPRPIILTGGSETTLVADGYPYPEPAVTAAGSTNHVLYVRDNAGRLAENRTELVHVFDAGAGWSASTPVWDDGTADFAPQVAGQPDGALLAVWANVGSVLTNGATLDETLAGLEIAAGRRDPATGVWACQNLTTNAFLDHSPALAAASNGNAMVAWIRNRYQNPTGTTNEPNELLVAHWDGSAWSGEAAVATNLDSLTYLDLACKDAEAVLLFALDLDSDLSTQGDQELFGCTYAGGAWGAVTRLSDNAVQDTRPYVRYDADGGLVVVWFQDGKVVSAEGLDLANPVEIGEIGIASGAQDFKLVAGPDGQLAVVWQDVGAEGVAAPDPHIMNYDPARALWSGGVRLLEDPALERGFSGAFGADGRLRLAYAKAAVGEDAEGVPAFGAVDLCVLDHPVGPDPAIGPYGISLSTNAAEVGESVDILVTVENRGELAVTNLAVCVYEGNPSAGGALIGSTQRVAQLLGGASVVLTTPWTIPQAGSNVAIYATLDPELETDDRNRANNTATLAAIMPDLAVEGALVRHETANVRLLTATVINEGSATAAEGVRVTFRRGASDGALLAEETLGAMVPGTNGVYDAGFRWDMAGTVFTSAYEMVYIAVDPDDAVEEIDGRNNTSALQVMTSLDTDTDGLLDGEELRLGTDVLLVDSDDDGLLDGNDVTLTDTDARYHAWAAAGVLYVDDGGLRTFRSELTLGTDPLKWDSDGDGMSDGDEVRAGTDPISATDVFKIVTADGEVGYVSAVTWNVKAGRTYRIKTTDDLQGAWAPAPDGTEPEERNERTATEDGILRYLDPSPGPVKNRFYRVEVMP